MRRQVHPASGFAVLCEVADIGRKTRREAAMAPRQTSRKYTSRALDYRIRKQTAELSLLLRVCRSHAVAAALSRGWPSRSLPSRAKWFGRLLFPLRRALLQ